MQISLRKIPPFRKGQKMKINLIILCCIVSSLFFSFLAQDFSGRYSIQDEGSDVVLMLHPDDQNAYKGKLTGNGISFELAGSVQNGILEGTIENEGILFQAQLNGDQLTLIMAETDDYGNFIPETIETLLFKQESENVNAKANQDEEIKNDIIINNLALSEEQIADLENTYGVKPLPGKYWYDARSGLYGVVGFPAYGFMQPDHTFGTLERNASNGDTGVIVNRRELPQSEWAVWSYIIGSWIQPGAYWLDHNGNAGYEGNPIPTINLYVAAQQNAYRGQGGSGDNFWSTRFSAGNYDSGNQRGYVSVPGYGPVGYGF
jgi:hypothetical protein